MANYEAAWRAPGTEGLAGLFRIDATYLHSPYEEPIVGLEAIRRMWDEDRDGGKEIFTLTSEILAVEGATAGGGALRRPRPSGISRPVDPPP